MNDFFKNILAYPSALIYVLGNGLTKYFIVSGFISLGIGAIAFGGVYFFSDDLGGLLINFYPFDWGKEAVTKVATVIVGTLLSLLSPFSAVGIFLVQAFYIGFANTDYHLEKRCTVRESVTYGRNNKWALMGNGTGFLLLLFIPVVGLLVAPVLGTVVATRDALSKGY